MAPRAYWPRSWPILLMELTGFTAKVNRQVNLMIFFSFIGSPYTCADLKEIHHDALEILPVLVI